MTHKPLRVMIVGAGTGGLCLAHGLQMDGIAVEVFERDPSPADRLPGYRLSLSATGKRALMECLPETLFDQIIEHAAKPSQGATFLDHQLKRLLSIDFPQPTRRAMESELPVSRRTLRRFLFEGCEHLVQFGKKCVGYEEASDGIVTAYFADGSTATGDILVGADGASSHLRAQLLPQAQRVETGIIAITGKFRLNDETRAITPAPLFRGPTLAFGPRGCFLFSSAIEYDTQVARDSTAEAPDAAEREEYVMWGFSAPREVFGLPANFEVLGATALKTGVIALMETWHPDLVRLVLQAEEASVTAFAVKTSIPIPPWKTGRVTLLGDALHNMTPFRGIGANTALRDAAALRCALLAADRGEQELIQALATYERDMIDYGFRAVRLSLQDLKRFHTQSTLARTATKAVFRAADFVPPLQRLFLQGR